MRIGYGFGGKLEAPTSVIGPENFTTMVIGLIRDARHDMINAIHAERGLEGGGRLTPEINTFAGTDFEHKHVEAKRDVPRTIDNLGKEKAGNLLDTSFEGLGAEADD